MLRDNCQLAENEAWFKEGCSKYPLKSGLTIVGPITYSLRNPDSPPWRSAFAVIYPDDMHIHLAEYYRQLPKSKGSGGCLEILSYHYGPCRTERDEDGFPLLSDRFELRIDIDHRNGRHIHYMNEDHIPEARLPGLDFDSIDPFKFIRAVEEHRKSSKPLHEILGFNVEPAK